MFQFAGFKICIEVTVLFYMGESWVFDNDTLSKEQ